MISKFANEEENINPLCNIYNSNEKYYLTDRITPFKIF